MEEIKEAQCASCLKGNLQLYSWIVKSLGCPRCGVFNWRYLWQPNDLRLPGHAANDCDYMATSSSCSQSCRPNPGMQMMSKDAIFFSMENMAISSATKSYFNPFWARLQRVRKKTFNCAGGFLIFLGTSTVVPWTSLGKPRHYASDPLKLSYASLAGVVFWAQIWGTRCEWYFPRSTAFELHELAQKETWRWKRNTNWPSNFLLCPGSAWDSRASEAYTIQEHFRGGLYSAKHIEARNILRSCDCENQDGRRCHFFTSMDAFYIVLSRCFLSKNSIWRYWMWCRSLHPFFRYAGLLGFLRSAMKEHPELRLRLLCREAEAPVLLLGRTCVEHGRTGVNLCKIQHMKLLFDVWGTLIINIFIAVIIDYHIYIIECIQNNCSFIRCVDSKVPSLRRRIYPHLSRQVFLQ